VGLSDWQPRGGELWLGHEGGVFERAPDAELQHHALSQAVAWADLDNDGWLDLYVVDGGVEGASARNLLFFGRGDGRFVQATSTSGATPALGRGRGSAVHPVDYDGDGRLDLFLLNGLGVPPFDQGPYVLLHNAGPAGHWIEVRLRGMQSNRQGLGAWVEIEACGLVQKRYNNGGAGTLSQSAVPVHFGLGTCARMDDLVVRWPSGRIQTLDGVAVDRVLDVTEPR